MTEDLGFDGLGFDVRARRTLLVGWCEFFDWRKGVEIDCLTVRNTLQDDETPARNIASDDKDKIEKALQEALVWLDNNQLAEKDEMEAKVMELMGIVNPIMCPLWRAAAGRRYKLFGPPWNGGLSLRRYPS